MIEITGRTKKFAVEDNAPPMTGQQDSPQQEPGTPRTCLLVLGMHRSGTSALARTLNLLGAALPQDLLGAGPGNEAGHWEPARLVALHDQMLAEAGTSWNDWQAFDPASLPPERAAHYKSEIARLIGEEYDGAMLFVLKDPRICRFVPLYDETLAATDCESRAVIMVRNPLEVAASLEKRDGMAHDRAALLWLRHVLDAEAATRGRPRAFLSYDNLLADWKTALDGLAARLGVAWPRTIGEVEGEIGEFLTSARRHHEIAPERLGGDPAMSAWIVEAFAALRELERDPASVEATGKLDAVNREFRNAAPVIAQLEAEARRSQAELEGQAAALSEASARAEALAGQLKEREAELANKAASLSEATARSHALAGQLEEREAALSTKERSEQGLHEEMDTLKMELEQTTAELQATESERTRLEKKLQRSQAQQKEARSRLRSIENEQSQTRAELEQALSGARQLAAELQQARSELENARSAFQAVMNSRSWKVTEPMRMFSRQRTRAVRLMQLLPSMRDHSGGYIPLARKFLSAVRAGGLTGARERVRRFVAHRAGGVAMPFVHGSAKQVCAYDRDWRRILWRQMQHNRPSALDGALEVRPDQVPTLAEKVSEAGLPLISLLTPVYNTDEKALRELFESVRGQSYSDWQWILVDDASPNRRTRKLLRELAAGDDRIKLVFRRGNGGISAATNDALELAEGEYIGLLDHDDLLSRDALFEVARVINGWPDVDFIYSDEDKIDEAGRHYEPYFKPDWSPSLLLARMYTCHFSVYRRSLVAKAGGFRSQFDGTQDYDLALRISELTDRVCHIPRILYHWRVSSTSTAGDITTKGYAVERQKAALEEALQRRGIDGAIHPTIYPGNWRPYFDLPKPEPLVSIVIPTAGRDATIRGNSVNMALNCVESIVENSTYENIELVVIHNGDMDDSAYAKLQACQKVMLVLYSSAEFNLAEKINLGVEKSRGEYVILLNDDTEIITPDWIESLLRIAQQEDVGAVGAKLFFENGNLQHAGVVVMDQGPSHANIGAEALDPGRDLVNHLLRDVIAVTGACLMCRRDRYQAVGGFDTALPLNYNDVDFCLKLRERGWRNVMEPSAQLYHFESISKSGTYQSELDYLRSKWGRIDDPYYNLNFDRTNPFFRPLSYDFDPPRDYETWLAKDIASRVGAVRQSGGSDTLYSFVTSAYDTEPRFLEELASNVFGQVGCRFEWVLVDNGSTRPDTIETLKRISGQDDRVRYHRVEENLGIIGGMRHGLLKAEGDYILPLDSDDLLTSDALSSIDRHIRETGFAPLYYTDEDKSNEASGRFSPFLKPDWDPVMFLGCCYVAHLCAIDRKVALELGAYADDNATGCHDWDTFYKFIRKGIEPVHVPALTYAWRIHSSSTASADPGVKPFTINSQEYVLSNHIRMLGKDEDFEIAENPLYGHSGMWRLLRRKRNPERVLVVLLQDDAQAAPSVVGNYPLADVEIIDGEDRLLPLLRARAHAYDAVAVLGEDIAPREKDWIWEGIGLLGYFDDAAVVGGRIVDADGITLWSGGYFGFREGRECPYHGIFPGDSGYYGSAFLQRTVDTVSPLVWMASSDFVIDAIGKAGEMSYAQLAGTLACKAHEKGKRIIATPFITAARRASNGGRVSPDIKTGSPPVIKRHWYPRQMSSEHPYELRQ